MITRCPFSDGPKAKIKLMHHGELLAGIDERLGTPEMNTVLTLTQEEHDDKERREQEKQQDEQPETSKKKGKKGNEDKKSK